MKQAPVLSSGESHSLKRLVRRMLTSHEGEPLPTWLKVVTNRLLMAGTFGRGLARNLPRGEVVRVHPQYHWLSWNLEEYAAFRESCCNPRVILDIGANVGAYSVLFGIWARRSGGRVFAFEPSPTIYPWLKRHIQLNHLDTVVTSLQLAVSSKNGFVGWDAGESEGAGHLALESPTPDSTSMVRTTSLDAFCASEKVQPDVVKIDVEGFEFEVLEGASVLLGPSRGSSIPTVFVELHPTAWTRLGRSREDWLALLDRFGLKMTPLNPAIDVWSVEGVCVRLSRAS